MIWRAWCFVAGWAPGALAALAVLPERGADLRGVELGALAGGLLMVVAGSLLDRLPQTEPDRGAALAGAASAGLVAVPAAAAALLGLAPGPRVWLVAVAALLVAAFFRAVRRRAPAGGPWVQSGMAAAWLAGGSAAVLLVSGLTAALGSEAAELGEGARHAVLDHDATVELLPRPSCAPRAARLRVLHADGAHPRLADAGREVWFDAPAEAGRRQIHRLRRDSGEVTCFTCGEPGHNVRPAPNGSGTAVAFETDRHATWRHPANAEIHLLGVASAERGVQSRRLTFSSGPDGSPLFAPFGGTIVWSSAEAGRYRVLHAALRSGHGSLQLGRPVSLREGGADWIAPASWSPDARTFAVVRGNPLGPPRVDAHDPAKAEPVRLGGAAAGAGALSFSADGAWYALAGTRRGAAAGLLPGAFGFVLAPALEAGGDGARFQGTSVLWGPVRGEPRAVELGDAADWGWPTGLALEPDGTGFVLGQRRQRDWGLEERLVAVRLDCP